MSKLFYKDYEVEIQHKPRLKNTYIGIGVEDKILVKTSSKSHSYIMNLLEIRDSWIQKQFRKQKKYISLEMNLENEVLLFSHIYSIDSQEASSLRIKLNKLKVNSPPKVMKCYDDFYKSGAEVYIKNRVLHFSNLMGLSFNVIKYRKMKSRWGSCSSLKTLTFNTQLMKIDKNLIDYVVIHELAHLKHMNHSKDFHALVEVYLTHSKLLREELKNIRLL